jgi:hypothetical protein
MVTAGGGLKPALSRPWLLAGFSKLNTGTVTKQVCSLSSLKHPDRSLLLLTKIDHVSRQL